MLVKHCFGTIVAARNKERKRERKREHFCFWGGDFGVFIAHGHTQYRYSLKQ